jgi:hypothetical protein
MLKIHSSTDYCREFLNRIQNKLNKAEAAAENQTVDNKKDLMEVDEELFFGIAVINDNNEFQVKRLFELTNEDERFILEVHILELFPDKVYDIVSLFCENCITR